MSNTEITINCPDPSLMPDVVLTAAGNVSATQLVTLPNVEWLLGEMGVSLRWNVMERCRVFCLAGVAKTGEREQDQIYNFVIDMAVRMRMKDRQRLDDLLTVAAKGDPFHPMADWVPQWDGVSRFEALAATVPTDSTMWRTYLRKWLVEVCEAIFGWNSGEPRSLPNVLCFVGSQGIGKGRWLRALAPSTYVMADAELHLGSSQGKDHQMQALRYPIVELGEIDSTFRKADVSALKAFLSRQTDEIREPYARTASKHLRCTVFFGTVNNVEFLNDGTGTRRYWPIEATGPIQWDHGIDMPQLWAEAASWWEAGEDWFLNAEQDAARVAATEEFTMLSPVVDLVAAHIREHGEEWDHYVLANKTEILALCGVNNPSMAQVADVTQWLTNTFGKARKISGKHRCWAVPRGLRQNVECSRVIDKLQAQKLVRWREKHSKP